MLYINMWPGYLGVADNRAHDANSKHKILSTCRMYLAEKKKKEKEKKHRQQNLDRQTDRQTDSNN